MTSFRVRPHAVCTPRVLFAVTGPSMKLNGSPFTFFCRSLWKIEASSHQARICRSSASWSGCVASRSNTLVSVDDIETGRVTGTLAKSGSDTVTVTLVSDDPLTATGDRVAISVWVVPGSSRSVIDGRHGD